MRQFFTWFCAMTLALIAIPIGFVLFLFCVFMFGIVDFALPSWSLWLFLIVFYACGVGIAHQQINDTIKEWYDRQT